MAVQPMTMSPAIQDWLNNNTMAGAGGQMALKGGVTGLPTWVSQYFGSMATNLWPTQYSALLSQHVTPGAYMGTVQTDGSQAPAQQWSLGSGGMPPWMDVPYAGAPYNSGPAPQTQATPSAPAATPDVGAASGGLATPAAPASNPGWGPWQAAPGGQQWSPGNSYARQHSPPNTAPYNGNAAVSANDLARLKQRWAMQYPVGNNVFAQIM